jgi:hypothetical protein
VKRAAWLLLLVLTTAACGAKGAQPQPPQPPPAAYTAVDAVITTTAGNPIEGAGIVCNGTDWGVTNGDGYLVNPQVPAFTQQDCTVSREGYFALDLGHHAAPDTLGIRAVLQNVPLPEPVNTLTPLRVEDNKRWFANAAGRFDYREYSAFALLGMLQHGQEAQVRENLQWFKARGFTVARVFVVYRYSGPHAGPDQPNFYQSLNRLLEIAGQEGMYLRLTYIAATEPWGGVWYPDRRDIWEGRVREGGEAFVRELTAHLCGQPGIIGELANEPGQIGMNRSFHELVALGREAKGICPSLLLGGGAVDGPNDQDPTFAVEPFDYVDAHIERRTAVWGFEWIKRSGEYALIDQDHVQKRMPFISGEPINFIGGRGDDRDESPAVAFAYGAVSRARQYNTNYHFDDGLYGRIPTTGHESIRCYHDALDAFPMLTDGKWRGHWGLGAGDYWRNDWPNTDDTRGVEDHIRNRRGPWRAFGAGIFSVLFPYADGYNWQAAAEVPVTQVASCSANGFTASVFRRQ